MVESDGNRDLKMVKVGVIAHHHPDNIASLVISALRAMENVEVVELDEKAVFVTEDGVRASIKGLAENFPEAQPYGVDLLSPYGWMGRRGKGEKKRERAMQRRFYGRGNSF